MYLSLARKYRPKTFASVAVQSHVSATLKGAIARGRVAHGYLLCGPRGVGKTTLARVLAMALNCERRSASATDAQGPAPDQLGEPCGECASCMRIWSGSASLDVVEIDAASNRGVDDARDLRERAMYAPSTEGHYKIYIVDEAHMLTREAWNALLKILEEPPPGVVFVFATTEPQKIAQSAAPVLSRLQRFDFKRIGPADVRARLTEVLETEGVQAEADALTMLARAADGSMRDALSLTDQVLSMGDGSLTAAAVREALGLVAEDEYLAVMDLIAERKAAEVFPFVSRLSDAGVDLVLFLVGLGDVIRAQLALSLGGDAPDMTEHVRERLRQTVDRFAPGDLLRMLNAIADAEPRLRRGAQQKLLLETLLVRFALMERTVELEEVLRAIGDERTSPAGSAPPGERRPAPRPEQPASRSSAQAMPAEVRAKTVDREAPSSTSIEPSASRSAVAQSTRSEEVGSRSAPRARAELELNALAERWGDIIAMAAAERPFLRTALSRAMPAAVTGRGEITLELDSPDEIAAQAIESCAADVLDAISSFFSGARRLRLTNGENGKASAPPRRVTADQVRADRISSLRKQDPTLAAAIDALELELME